MSRKDNSDDKFDMGQWCDYVRGLLDSDTESRMNRHLERSASSREQVAALRQVLAVAASEAASTPPDWAVRSAKAMGSLARKVDETRPSWLRRFVMSVSFDSLASPALVGTRDVQTLDRHLVFDADDYRVDLRIEPEADFQGAVYVGQFMRKSDDVEPMVDVPVLAVRGDSILGHAKTGRFGEFQASGLPGSNLGLRLILEDDTCLEIEVGHNEFDGNHSGDSA